jgi:hypothetical protein
MHLPMFVLSEAVTIVRCRTCNTWWRGDSAALARLCDTYFTVVCVSSVSAASSTNLRCFGKMVGVVRCEV